MLFNSYIFILLFLPISLLGYYYLNRLPQAILSKIWLIACSFVFYTYVNPIYVIILILSIGINYILHWLLTTPNTSISSANTINSNYRIIILCIGVTGNVLPLFYFKYYNFFITNLNSLFNTDYILKNIILPLGISFFTFQQIALLVDSYKGDAIRYKFIDYCAFISFFPQISSGPISLHSELIPQFTAPERKFFSSYYFAQGLRYFSMGLAKKVLIADTLGQAVQIGFDNYRGLNSLSACFVMFAYTLQIYFDFSGYTDMAVGIGKMFHIDLPINFTSPYKSKSISEFWKSWHITLTRFFTKYVYIPLGGNRKGKYRTYLNIFIIFALSGLWHGSNWTFVLWGILHGVALILYRIFRKWWDKVPAIIGIICTFIYVNFAWIVFRSNSLIESKYFVGHLLGGGGGALMNEIATVFPVNAYLFLALCFAIVFLMPSSHEIVKKEKWTIRNALFDVILVVLSMLSLSEVSTFLYYTF